MKKALYLFTLMLLINIYSSNECKNDNAKGSGDCEKLDPDEGDYKCCYYEYDYEVGGEKGTAKGCESISKENYDNIKDYIKKEEEDTDVGSIDLSIDCYSNYITISLISLLILLL